MNNGGYWHPETYTIQTKVIHVQLLALEKINKKFAEDMGKELGTDNKFRRHSIEKKL